jgi:bifunctional non-homologous end joining protein LigD
MPRVEAGSRSRLTADSPAALAWVAGRTPFDLRASTAAPGAPDRPTWAIIEVAAGPSASATLGLLRTALDHLGLEGRPVVGGACNEVRIPINPRQSNDDVGAWVDQLSAAIAATLPDAPPPRRTDDATFVVPFAPLDAPGAPVVVPIGWDEVDDDTSWTITDVGDRLARSGDPLAPLIGLDQRLPRL